MNKEEGKKVEDKRVRKRIKDERPKGIKGERYMYVDCPLASRLTAELAWNEGARKRLTARLA